jgi:hypothetical protein
MTAMVRRTSLSNVQSSRSHCTPAPASEFNQGQGIEYTTELQFYKDVAPGKKRRLNEARAKAPLRTMFLSEAETVYHTIGICLQDVGRVSWMDHFPEDCDRYPTRRFPTDYFTILAGVPKHRAESEVRTPAEFLAVKKEAIKREAAKIRFKFLEVLRTDEDEEDDDHEDGPTGKRAKVRVTRSALMSALPEHNIAVRDLRRKKNR